MTQHAGSRQVAPIRTIATAITAGALVTGGAMTTPIHIIQRTARAERVSIDDGPVQHVTAGKQELHEIHSKVSSEPAPPPAPAQPAQDAVAAAPPPPAQPPAVQPEPAHAGTPAPAPAPVAPPAHAAPAPVTGPISITGRGASIAAAALGELGRIQDCTALVTNALAAAGIYFHGWPAGYLGLGVQVPAAQAQPGDLAYYADGGMGVPHIAVYVGNGLAVHGGWLGNETVEATVNVGSGPIFIRV